MKYVLVSVLVLLMVYAATAYISMIINPFEWSKEMRQDHVGVSFFISLGINLIAWAFNSKPKDWM